MKKATTAERNRPQELIAADLGSRKQTDFRRRTQLILDAERRNFENSNFTNAAMIHHVVFQVFIVAEFLS